MKIKYIFLFIGFQHLFYGQSGFNLHYDLGSITVSFQTVQLYEDTLLIYGNARVFDGEIYNQGILLIKLDTLGNVLNHALHFDPSGDLITLTYPNSSIFEKESKTSVCIGQLYQRRNGVFFIINDDFKVKKYQEYEDTSSRTDHYRNINKVDSGYLISGSKQALNYLSEIFIKKVDLQGNEIWEVKYGTSGMDTYLRDIFIAGDNEYVIAATTSNHPSLPLLQRKFSTRIFSVDSLGAIKWQWQSPYGLDERGASNISKTKEGHWAYFSTRGWHNEMYNEISIQPVFIVRDEQFNLIQYDTFAIADYPLYGFRKVIQLADSGWLAVGNRPVLYDRPPYTNEDYNAMAGWMLRLDADGNQLWSRTDTAFWDLEYGSQNVLHYAVELDGGSIVSVGTSRTYTQNSSKDWGWIIKVDKDGCIDTLCTTTSIQSLLSEPTEVKVFPNPAKDEVTFSLSTHNEAHSYELSIFDIKGRQLFQQGNISYQHSFNWDASAHPAGMYFYQLNSNDGPRYSGKIILQK